MSTPVTLESAELPLSAYRTLRDGGEVAPIDDPPAADPAVEQAAETAGAEGAPTNEGQPKASEKPDKLNQRFSELTTEIKNLKTQLAAVKPASTGPTEAPKPVEVPILPPDPKDPEPNPDKFTDHTDWLKEWNRWDRRQETRQAEHKAHFERAQAERVTRVQTWDGRVAEAKKEFADFETVAQHPDLPVTRAMGDAITDSEVGAKILYKLGQNPDEAKRISQLSPITQIREIGKLEAALLAESAAAAAAAETETETETDAEVPPAKIPVSKAPAPHRPITGAAAAGAVNPRNIEAMSQADYRAYRDSGKIR